MLNVLMSAYDRIGARAENFRVRKLSKRYYFKTAYSTSMYHDSSFHLKLESLVAVQLIYFPSPLNAIIINYYY